MRCTKGLSRAKGVAVEPDRLAFTDLATQMGEQHKQQRRNEPCEQGECQAATPERRLNHSIKASAHHRATTAGIDEGEQFAANPAELELSMCQSALSLSVATRCAAFRKG